MVELIKKDSEKGFADLFWKIGIFLSKYTKGICPSCCLAAGSSAVKVLLSCSFPSRTCKATNSYSIEHKKSDFMPGLPDLKMNKRRAPKVQLRFSLDRLLDSYLNIQFLPTGQKKAVIFEGQPATQRQYTSLWGRQEGFEHFLNLRCVVACRLCLSTNTAKSAGWVGTSSNCWKNGPRRSVLEVVGVDGWISTLLGEIPVL